MTRRTARASWGWTVAGVAGLLAAWQAACSLFRVPVYVLASPAATAQALAADAGLLARHAATTAVESVLGLVLALLFGVLVALAISASRVARGLLYPSLVLSQAVPLIAIAPLILIWLGLGPSAKILVAAFISFFPITVSTVESIQAIDPLYTELLETLGARRRDLYRHVVIPAAVPGIFAGLRVAATYCVLGAVVGEWLGGSRGLGVYMTRALQSFRTDRLFAAILLVMAMSYALFLLADRAGRAAAPWIRRRNHA